MLKILMLISIIVLLAIVAGQEMYKVRQLSATVRELELTKQAILDRRGKEVIHDELGDFNSSKEDSGDVFYDPTSINGLYDKGR